MANENPNWTPPGWNPPGWEPEPPPPPLPANQAQRPAQPTAPARQRPGNIRFIRSAAIIGWILPLLVSLFALLVAGLYVFIANYDMWWWWLPLVSLWLLGLGATIVATMNRPRSEPGQFNFVGLQIVLGYVFAGSSGFLLAIAVVVVSLVTHARKPEVQAALKKQRQAQQAVQMQARREKQAAEEVERRLLAQEVRQREEKAERKRAEEDSEAGRQYAAAFVQRLKHGDDSSKLPAYDGNFIPWANHGCEYSEGQFPAQAVNQNLVQSEQVNSGYQVRQLALSGATLVPKVELVSDQETFLYLLQRDGTLLQISPTTWEVKQRISMGGPCTDLALIFGQLLITRSKPGSLIAYTPPGRFNGRGLTTPIAEPLRVVGYGSGDSRQVVTGGSEPLWASLYNSGRLVEWVKKRSEVEPAAADSLYAPSQRLRHRAIDSQGHFTVIRKDGVFRGQLPPHVVQHGGRSGFISQDEKSFVVDTSYHPLAGIVWQPVVRGQGLNPEAFDTFGAGNFASSTAQKNLVIYDRAGQLKASLSWPMAGKTLAVCAVPTTQALLVFTERSLFVVTPAAGGVASTTQGSNSPGATSSRPGGLSPNGTSPKYVKSYLAGSFTPAPEEPAPFKLEWKEERAPGGQMVKSFGRTQPGAFLFSPDGSQLWMLRYGILHRVNPADWTADAARTLMMNGSFQQLLYTREGLVVVKGFVGAEAVYVIDPQTLAVKVVWNTNVERGSPFSTDADFAAARDGKLVAFLLNSGESCEVMDLSIGGVIAEIKSAEVPGQGKVPQPIYGIAMSPDGKSLVVATNRIHRYDLSPNGIKHMQMSEPVVGSTLALSISGDSRRLLSQGQDAARVFDLSDLETVLHQFKLREQTDARLDPTGEFIWAEAGDKFSLEGNKLESYQLDPLHANEQFVFAGKGNRLFFGEFLIEQK
jgi:hypothetical protein